MEKKELKLKKETLTNLTNLNQREIEEIKGGVVALQEAEATLSTITIVSVSVSVSVTLTWSKSWSW
jgi:hypothetical protein